MKKSAATDGIRLDLVKKFRKEIIERKYEVKSDEIASKMANEIFSVKNSIMLTKLKI